MIGVTPVATIASSSSKSLVALKKGSYCLTGLPLLLGLLLALGGAVRPCVLAALWAAARAGTLNAGRGAKARRARRRVRRRRPLACEAPPSLSKPERAGRAVQCPTSARACFAIAARCAQRSCRSALAR